VLWPDMEEAVRLFMAMNSQWRMHPVGGLIGLDYAALLAAAQMMGFTMSPQLFDDVRALEAGALDGFAEKRRTAR
jgi:hypothetical protein